MNLPQMSSIKKRKELMLVYYDVLTRMQQHSLLKALGIPVGTYRNNNNDNCFFAEAELFSIPINKLENAIKNLQK